MLSSSEYGEDESSSSEGSEEEMLAIVNHQHSNSLIIAFEDNDSPLATRGTGNCSTAWAKSRSPSTTARQRPDIEIKLPLKNMVEKPTSTCNFYEIKLIDFAILVKL